MEQSHNGISSGTIVLSNFSDIVTIISNTDKSTVHQHVFCDCQITAAGFGYKYHPYPRKHATKVAKKLARKFYGTFEIYAIDSNGTGISQIASFRKTRKGDKK